MNALRKTLVLTLLSGSLFSPIMAHAVQKFGYVNPTRVYTETQTAQRIESSLQQEFSTQRQQLQNLEQQGIALQKQLQTGKLSSKERKQTEEKLIGLSRQYRIMATQLGEEYALRRNEEFAALQQNANNVIKDIAEQEQYDLIVQEVVFVSRHYDITDRVIQRLDAMQ